MKIKDFKCKCGHNDFFLSDKASRIGTNCTHCGIYCSYCGKWLKWADKDEQNLAMKQEPKSEWEHDHEILKAYSDGANEVIDKIRAEIEQLPTKTRTNWDGCCPDIDYPEIEYVDVTKNKLLNLIDKYKSESERKTN